VSEHEAGKSAIHSMISHDILEQRLQAKVAAAAVVAEIAARIPR